ncbi:MAG: ectoine/hydroxyectoine ABC transporter permease subunit EhuD [Streptosporangiales bacterium]|nr:ectoine/hydroxyectoine ABC transporter permease subunit EhuD [Streptosporangiales bacterium]
MIWDWNFALNEALPQMLGAFLKVTLLATILGSVVAMVLGLILALLRRSRIQLISRPTGWFIEFVRSTPLLVQLLFLFLVLPRVGITLPAFTIGIIGLGVHYATYTSEVYRAGIDGVPKGQWEAATALSLPPRRKWQDVILPQAIRNVLPALGNYVISMFKETPYLLAITVLDMVAIAKNIGSLNFKYLETFTIAGLIFLAASYPAAVLMRKLEIRLGH